MDFLDLHPFVRITAYDKALGTVIGSALGDCIGLYTEFLPRTECLRAYPSAKFSLTPNQTAYRSDSHRDKFDSAGWTDDTDQALLLILSYLHDLQPKNEVGRPVDPLDFAQRLQIWVRQGLRCLERPPLGIGQTVGRVVLDPDYLAGPEEMALKIWLKSNRNAAPNGSLMRTHPLGVMCVVESLEDTFRIATDVGKVTHVDPRCVVSCCLVTGLLRGILRGEVVCEADIDSMIDTAFDWVEKQEELMNPRAKNLDEKLEEVESAPVQELESRLVLDEYHKYSKAQSLEELELDDATKMGYVFKCLGSAILTLRLAIRNEDPSGNHQLFETLISNLIMQGGDADTNACVAGALLGAWIGYSRLPPHWENGIRDREWLIQKADAMITRAGLSRDKKGNHQVPTQDPDTALDGGKGMLTTEQLAKMERDVVVKILEKQKERRDAEENERKGKKGNRLGKWFS
jgi:ADP-ribosylglycohydrolase